VSGSKGSREELGHRRKGERGARIFKILRRKCYSGCSRGRGVAVECPTRAQWGGCSAGNLLGGFRGLRPRPEGDTVTGQIVFDQRVKDEREEGY